MLCSTSTNTDKHRPAAIMTPNMISSSNGLSASSTITTTTSSSASTTTASPSPQLATDHQSGTSAAATENPLTVVPSTSISTATTSSSSLSAVIAEAIGEQHNNSNSISTTSDQTVVPDHHHQVAPPAISESTASTGYSNGWDGSSSVYNNSVNGGHSAYTDPTVSYIDPSYYHHQQSANGSYHNPEMYDSSYGSAAGALTGAPPPHSQPLDPNAVYYGQQQQSTSVNNSSGSSSLPPIAETTYLLTGLIDHPIGQTGSSMAGDGLYSGYIPHHQQQTSEQPIADHDSQDSQGGNAAPTYLDLATPAQAVVNNGSSNHNNNR